MLLFHDHSGAGLLREPFDSNRPNSPPLESWGWWDLNQSLQALSLRHQGLSGKEQRSHTILPLAVNQDLFGNPLPRPTGYTQNISLCTTCALLSDSLSKPSACLTLSWGRRAVRVWPDSEGHLSRSLVVLCSFLSDPSLFLGLLCSEGCSLARALQQFLLERPRREMGGR